MKNLTEAYNKANTFVNENIEKWTKEYDLTEEQVKAIYDSLAACEYLGVDITEFPGYELM